MAITFLIMTYVLVNRSKTREVSNLEKAIDELQHVDYKPREFSYRELLLATKKFSEDEIIGQGGFGTVYRGKVPRRRAVVAVKRLSTTRRPGANLKEFVAEVEVIGRLKHGNMVPLLGWCHDQQRGEMLLVYKYMSNGNLQELLFCNKDSTGRASTLDWKMRMKILRGVAAALVFLHEDCEQRVVHRDVKSSNVLLDEDFNARLGDFGLARLYDRSEDHHSTDVVGTIGYLAPESIIIGNATVKSDVYSFGAMALEVATGREPADWQIPGEQGLVHWVWSLHGEGRLLDAIDPNLGKNYNTKEMKQLLRTGLFCCIPDPEARPTMRQVQAALALQCETPVLSSELPLVPEFDLTTLIRKKYALKSSDSTSNYACRSDVVPQFNPLNSSLPHASASATLELSD